MALLALAVAMLLPQKGVLVPGHSLGGVKLGMSRAQVETTWGKTYGRCSKCKRETWYFNYEKFHPEGAAVRFRRGRVDAVWTLWKPPGWRVGTIALGVQSATFVHRFGTLLTIPCGSYQARVLTRGNVMTVFYIYGNELWGFGLNRQNDSPCH